jgi:hypothetical protein
LLARGLPDWAEVYLRLAVELGPRGYYADDALYSLVQLYGSTGDPEAATRAASRLLAEYPASELGNTRVQRLARGGAR